MKIFSTVDGRELTFEEIAGLLERLSFSEYQRRAAATAVYPHVAVNPNSVGESCGGDYIYPALGLCGEAGEVAEKIKKIVRDKDGFVDATDRAAVAKELGDVLWYVAALCKEFQLDMGEVAQGNLDKLAARAAKGTLGGSGDNR
jgi:NTP pyrophosphatase (non-canonical NTP hydrolase)